MNSKPVIMIVDDEIANIEMIGAILEDDYEILFARSGEQAIGIAQCSQLDLILLDVVMQGMDGYETCRRIKLDPDLANVPVIFTTGLDSVECEIRGLSVGAIDYVTKPVQPVSLRCRVSNHVSLKRMRDQLANQALIDPLTGLGNRRMLEALLAEEMTRLARSREELSILLMDIDYFKQFNDMYGHLEGDRCIAAVAEALGAAMRRGGDMCVRYGGEEFACVLPRTGYDGAMHLAELLRSQVEALAIPHAGSSCAPVVTISIGVAVRRCAPDLRMKAWFETADRMLYDSKNEGRNQITGIQFDEA
ncbi:diguanylate cyclase [Paracoccus xiamenensis]|uniref:diguanylate cyclase n=1 Tax=Paracoccus xiamenensis TaxID=2714901 RepID=UPI0014074A9D|nr:diguanylate cyclase [Paracoccus xiamenensis]NHF73268.1 diguanylate cyclase [Paracoccus xiamenensis]